MHALLLPLWSAHPCNPFVQADTQRVLYFHTAQQLGLLQSPQIPDLVTHLLPKNASVMAARFLRQWLVCPPPPDLADQMQALMQVCLDSWMRDP